MRTTRGQYGKLIRTWKVRIDSVEHEVKVFIRDNNSRDSYSVNKGTAFWAINEQHDIKLSDTDIAKLETAARAELKKRVTTKWEPWLMYELSLTDRRDNEIGLSIQYELIDRADIGKDTERYRKMDEYDDIHGKFVRNPYHGDPTKGAPHQGHRDLGPYNRDNKNRLEGVVLDTPANRAAFDEVQDKLRQLYAKLAGHLKTPELAQGFLSRVFENKVPQLPAGKPKRK